MRRFRILLAACALLFASLTAVAQVFPPLPAGRPHGAGVRAGIWGDWEYRGMIAGAYDSTLFFRRPNDECELLVVDVGRYGLSGMRHVVLVDTGDGGGLADERRRRASALIGGYYGRPLRTVVDTSGRTVRDEWEGEGSPGPMTVFVERTRGMRFSLDPISILDVALDHYFIVAAGMTYHGPPRPVYVAPTVTGTAVHRR